jgi:NAD-dependent deacetylase
MLSKDLFKRLYNATAIVVLTGQGVSVESGLSGLSGEDGGWKGLKAEEIRNVNKFNEDPGILWDWFRWQQEEVSKVKPNLAHYALVDFENRFEDFTLITQNTDGLHKTAGSKRIIEIHGNIFEAVCPSCGHKEENFKPDNSLPKCPECGTVLRPNVFMEGDELDSGKLKKAQESSAFCEVFFSIGACDLVDPIKALPFVSKANGSYLVEIGIKESVISDKVNERIEGKASEWLPKITILYDKITGKS